MGLRTSFQRFSGILDCFPREARIADVEDHLPLLLGDIAAHLRSGLTAEQALKAAAVSGESGLHSSLRMALARVSAEHPLSRELEGMAEQVGSEQLARVVGLLVPAISGGSLSARLLEELRSDLDERQALKREFAVSTRSFVAFIRLSVVLLMPALLALSLVFLDRLADIIGETSLGAADLGMASVAVGAIPDTVLVSKLAYLLVGGTALFAAMLESVIKHGSWLQGLKKAPLYILSAEMVFGVAGGMLAQMV